MPSRRSTKSADPRDVAAEIIRRFKDADGRTPYVVRLSEPPTASERLQLVAARLTGTPIVIMPHECRTVAEWVTRYADRLR